jgi:glycerol-3-phosphate dehydrogenase (NAD(P)+)
MRIAVLGAGAWGTALAIHYARRYAVTLWSRDDAFATALHNTRVNARYLPQHRLPAELDVTGDLDIALEAPLALIAVPTSGLRATLQQLEDRRWRGDLVWLCKGYEPGTGKLPHQVCDEVRTGGRRNALLSGPSFAEEVARGLPTAVTLGSADIDFARETARTLHGGSLRVYFSDDIVGMEVAGAMKNVMAIAVGVCDGLALGLNARAALITRGLAEIMRLGTRLGGRAETFMGLAGLGDLVLTCTGDLSRNRRVGLKLGAGEPLPGILASLGHVAEGVNTAREADRLAAALNVDMPITRAVCRLLDAPEAARSLVQELLQRDPKLEHER